MAAAMGRRIFYDGLNLALPRGTGIATYTRVLAGMAHELGYEIGVFFSVPQQPAKNLLLREIGFFDQRDEERPLPWRRALSDQLRYPFGVRPLPVPLTGAVIAAPFATRLPTQNHVFAARNLFRNARRYFRWSGRFATLDFEPRPDIVHCTYPLALKAKGARTIYTVHDLIPLRLPYTTLDDKREMFRLLRKIAAEADHIVTVSENSRRDLVELLGVAESRVTNTYEAVAFPPEFAARSDDEIAEQLRVIFRLGFKDYLLFFGALEPKKNVRRLIDAYLLSAVDIPLVIAGAAGWGNQTELQMIEKLEGDGSLRYLDYVGFSLLASLIRGARAVVFPSLYEGFGLPVLEAMTLGTPVVTSRVASLPEVAGDAALYVDPYDTDDIARAIKTIAADAGLRAELAERGRGRAELFSPARYRERVAALYRSLS
jgi:glycosyltransferase involved in cell wall biosynthesis